MTTSVIAEMCLTSIEAPTVAIVIFGAISSDMGMRPATFYQVTIDPSQTSPCGQFIRFGNIEGDEIVGWQKIDSMTIVSIIRINNNGNIYDKSIQFNIDSKIIDKQ